MGLFGAMTASVSGLSAQGEAISVISDNLSNTNTIGYKATRALFSQLVTTAGSGGSTYNAGGAQSSIQRAQSTQGSIISTTSGTDLSISGNGFFVVTDTSTITTDTSYFYSRAGAFSEDRNGFLVNPNGFYLQGWQTDSDGNILNLQEPRSIELQSVGVSAQASNEVRVGVNLTSTQTNNTLYNTGAALTAASNNLQSVVANPTLADYVADVRLFDAQGGARDVSIAFTKRSSNLWDWAMYTDGSNIEGGTTGTNSLIANGTLRFNQDGTLKYVTGDQDISVDWEGGISDGEFDAFFGDYTGGTVVTSTTGLDFTDHVRDISIEDVQGVTSTTAPTGTYTLSLTAANTWTMTDPNGQTANFTTTGTGEQELVFQFAGARNYDVRMTVSGSFAVTNGAYPLDRTFVAGLQNSLGQGAGSNGSVQFAASYNTSFINQNGFGSGTLSSIQVDEEGFISGTFTNGENKRLWKLSMGIFQNPAGLEAVSGSLYRTTEESGQVLLKEAGQGGTGSIISGSLEGSTVDIAQEFSNMIVSQRAYQANSTVISTVDQMLNELLQLR